MTLKTLSLWHMAISLNDTEMALHTGYPSCNIFLMIETPPINFNISFWGKMARSTPTHRTRKALPLSSRTSLVIVADETVGFMNRKVFSLNKLGVTTGTPEIHPPSQLT
jgi:hypothetical protein